MNPAAPGQPASAGVKGVMTSWNVSKEKATGWINGHQAALARLTAALGEGVLIANGGRNKFASGFMLETFTPGQIGTVQAAAAAGVVNQVHANMYVPCSPPYSSSITDCIETVSPHGCQMDGWVDVIAPRML